MCNNVKDQYHQETDQDQVNNQNSSQEMETFQNSNQDQKVDQKQNTTQEQTLEQIFKDKNVGISNLNIVINNSSPEKERSIQWEGCIYGRLLDSENVQPLTNKKISVYYASTAGCPVASLYSNDNGGYKISGLPPGYYTLRIYPDEHAINPTEIINIKVLPGSSVNQDILLPTPSLCSSIRKSRF